MNLRIFVINLLLISSLCQSFNTLNLSFTRTVNKDSHQDITEGLIYYDHKKATLKIIKPLLQWMILSDNQTVIYYPEEKRAIHIKSKSPITLPFFQSFIGIIKSDFGLAEIGYKLNKNELKGDTLYTYWIPPEEGKDKGTDQTLIFFNDKIIGLESYNNGEILVRGLFKDHFKYGGFHFPLQVNIVYYNKGQISEVENIKYSDPVFDRPFPEEVLDFKIPENIKVKEIEW